MTRPERCIWCRSSYFTQHSCAPARRRVARSAHPIERLGAGGVKRQLRVPAKKPGASGKAPEAPFSGDVAPARWRRSKLREQGSACEPCRLLLLVLFAELQCAQHLAGLGRLQLDAVVFI